jgi:hypothetical protein
MDHTSTSSTEGVGSTTGFYDLTTTYQTILTKSPTGYPDDSYTVEAKFVDATKDVVSFLVTFDTSGSGGNPDGTITSYIDEKRSTGVFTITSPTFTTVTELSAGG